MNRSCHIFILLNYVNIIEFQWKAIDNTHTRTQPVRDICARKNNEIELLFLMSPELMRLTANQRFASLPTEVKELSS